MSDRRTPDATLVSALRILARDIQSGDGCANACLLEVATRLEELVEERRSISTLLQKIESLEAENNRLREDRRWVPVGERLPEVGSLVLAFINGEVMEATFVGGGGLAWQTDRGGFNATHWMPLPPGPEGAKPELPTD